MYMLRVFMVSLYMYACGSQIIDSSFFPNASGIKIKSLFLFSFFFSEQACPPLCFPEMTSASGASSENVLEW